MGTYDTIGGTPRHDPEADMEKTCDVCGKLGDDCRCSECPKCGACGDPACYVEHGLRTGGGSVEMAYRKGFLARKRRQPMQFADYGGGSIGRQRRLAWMRGWERADQGKPLEDYNG